MKRFTSFAERLVSRNVAGAITAGFYFHVRHDKVICNLSRARQAIRFIILANGAMAQPATQDQKTTAAASAEIVELTSELHPISIQKSCAGNAVS